MRACTDSEVFVLDKDPVDAIACGAYISRGKPAPSVLEIARRRVRAGGDTPYDALAAARSHHIQSACRPVISPSGSCWMPGVAWWFAIRSRWDGYRARAFLSQEMSLQGFSGALFG
jgi:hypothetical protein